MGAGAAVARFFTHEDDYPDLPADAACARLGRVLSFPTVSSMDAESVDWGPFDELRSYLREAWPRVFAAGEVSLIDRSLLVVLPGSDPSLDPLMLMGHMDVVPVVPGTEGDWTHGPFSGHVDGKFIWGRGAIDMKDQVAGILEAVEYALSHGWELRRGIALAFGQDEETEQRGSRALAAELERRGIRPAFLVDEGDYRIVDGSEYGVPGRWLMHACLAEKGYVDVVLRTQSAGGHSSNPYGGSSLAVLARGIAAIDAIAWPVELTPLTRALLRELAPEAVEGPLAALGITRSDEVDERAGEIARACLSVPELFPLVTTTCAPTMIEGGSTGANVLPQDMWANINFRLIEGTSVDEVVARCREAVAGLPIEVELGPGSSEATAAPTAGGPGLAALRAVAARYFAADGEPVTVVPSTVAGATDAANYARICPECLRFSAFVVDDDECARGVHGTDERISRRAYLQGVRFMIRLIETVAVAA
ncbi:MAG: M20/M25/M40 family metallo-hydrolase [Coriobacteriaceae bacterium]|nr:M20/M25/M40 family metallo-hydrolase [Coriobacteriaceae bacterium]